MLKLQLDKKFDQNSLFAGIRQKFPPLANTEMKIIPTPSGDVLQIGSGNIDGITIKQLHDYIESIEKIRAVATTTTMSNSELGGIAQMSKKDLLIPVGPEYNDDEILEMMNNVPGGRYAVLTAIAMVSATQQMTEDAKEEILAVVSELETQGAKIKGNLTDIVASVSTLKRNLDTFKAEMDKEQKSDNQRLQKLESDWEAKIEKARKEISLKMASFIGIFQEAATKVQEEEKKG